MKINNNLPARLSASPALLALALLFSLVLVSAAPAENLTVSYSFDRPRIESVTIGDQTYDRVVMDNAPNHGPIGHPALPARGAQLLIPYGMKVTGVEIVSSGKIALGDNYRIEPVGQPFPLSADPATIKPPTPDKDVYALTTAVPETRFVSHGTQKCRGYEILINRLQPVEYIPATGQLYYHPELKLVVSLENAPRDYSLFRGLPGDENRALAKIDNPEVLSSYTAAGGRGTRNYDMMIITTSTLSGFFQPLEDYHDAHGLPTEIHTTDMIGSTDPTDVRDYIRNAYLNDGIQYVLIGGDDDIIPAVDLYVKSWDSESAYEDFDMPGDLYFGCLDGTYNFDGDDRWGEPTDGDGGGDVDLIAEVYVGRVSGSNAPEVYTHVSKILEYIQTTEPYLENVVMSGEHLRFGGWGEYGGYSSEEIIDFSTAHGHNTFGVPSNAYNIDRLYDLTWSPTNDWPASEIVDRINSGQHIINHYGHCNTDWAMKLSKTQLTGLFTNDDLCFMYSQGCYSGQFDDVDGWAEYATVNTENGAFAIVMNARYGWGNSDTDGPSQRFNREFWDAVYNPAENMPEMGKANQDSKEDNLYRIDGSCMRWCYYQLTLFGDPSVPFKEVKTLAFDYPVGIPEMITPDEAAFFEVTVGGVGSGSPVPGSGQLHYTINGGDLQSVPMSIIGPGNYQAELPALACDDLLEFYVSAQETENGPIYDPDPGTAHQALVIEDVVTLFEDDFETDKGWTFSGGLWARGVPTGRGGSDQQYPQPDPTGGSNGPSVYGYNLDGDYENLLGPMHLYSPPVNCTGHENVMLRFARWLGVEQPAYDHAAISVSNNGVDWTTVWENGSVISDLEWYYDDIDISAVADDQPAVTVRFTMGSTDEGMRYCGWNIDDVTVFACDCRTFICGDVDGDDVVNIIDITYLITYLYFEGPPPPVMASGDVNSDGVVNILDITYLLNYLYKGGPDPNCP